MQHDDCEMYKISKPVTAWTSYCSSDKSAKPASNEAWKKTVETSLEFGTGGGGGQEGQYQKHWQQWCLPKALCKLAIFPAIFYF